MLVGLAVIGVWFAGDWYGTTLRDPLFVDGLVLSFAMGMQLLLHLQNKRIFKLPGSLPMWSTLHIYTGFFVVGAFIIHTSGSLPDTRLEWILWLLFVVVVISGLIGTYLSRTIPDRLEQDGERISFDSMSALRSALQQRANSLLLLSSQQASFRLFQELYDATLHDFFKAPRNAIAHLRGSNRPLKRLMFELDAIEPNLNREDHQLLVDLKGLVTSKNQLDFKSAHEAALRVWLFVHVPATYALVVLSVLHALIVYAYRSGVD
ncbi:MAG: hypothetical protein JXQ99_17540 [Hyphomicrobiaceae bacterium]